MKASPRIPPLQRGVLNCGRMAALAAVACCCACGDSSVDPNHELPGGLPNDPPEFTLWEFDGYARDQAVELYWDASLFSESGPDTSRLAEAKIWMSIVGPNDGFALLQSGFNPGINSTLISDLTNGASYFFRLTAHDSLDGVVAASGPIWLQPGTEVPPEILVSAPQVGPNMDTLSHYRNLAWSPDGSLLAFVKISDEGASNLHTLRLVDASVSQVTHFAAGVTSTPAWSPSQDHLVFTHRDPYPRWGYRIWVGSFCRHGPNFGKRWRRS